MTLSFEPMMLRYDLAEMADAPRTTPVVAKVVFLMNVLRLAIALFFRDALILLHGKIRKP
jgi:hypothetical protein